MPDAIMNGSAGGWRGSGLAEDRATAAYRTLVGSLFSSPTSVLFSNVVGILIPVFCWSVTDLPIFAVLAVLLTLIVAARALLIARYVRRAHAQDSYDETRRWDREYLLGATLFSVVIGTVAYVALVHTEAVATHIVTVVGATAFASGYVARNAGRPSFVVVQILCFCVPTALGLHLAEESHYGLLALFVAFFVAANIAVTFSLNRNLLALADASSTSRELAETLRVKHAELDSALNAMTHGLVMLNEALELEVSNSKFLDLYGLAEDPPSLQPLAQISRQIREAGAIDAKGVQALEGLCRRVQAQRQPGAVEFATAAGRTLVVSVEPAPSGGILVLTEDATARRAAAAQIERMAHYDSLTGLANRFLFGQVLKASCAALMAGHGQPFSVLLIDLDNFKPVNDTLGHEAGDRLLIEAAARLRRSAAPGDLVARFGGDEFLVLARAGAAAAEEIGQAIIRAMAEPFTLGTTSVNLTASIGIALAPDHAVEPSDVLRGADIALYEAKGMGRNQAALFDPMMSEALRRRREIEVDLRSAVRSGHLLLHYQPLVDLASGRIRAYEALMRWDHPVRGEIPPSDFIPVSEQTGLICEMGAWALRKACRDAVAWPDDILVAVNVSPVQFRNTAELIGAVKRALKESGLAPNRLELEVTESLLIEDEQATLTAIRSLRRLGVRFSLDDFGIGYSSLGYLARYPFSKVKIDRSFAQHVATERSSRAIIEVVCQLAHRLGMQVVVEGIETHEQHLEIQRLGAEMAQGYLYARPEPLDRLVHHHWHKAA